MENKRINIVVLAKQVPDTKNVGKDAMKEDGTINRAALPAIFNPDDMKALEMALSCKDAAKRNSMDACVTVITMGPPRASEIIREALYRGADNGFVISDKRFAASDTLATSYALSMAIKKLGKVDLIFSGRQAIDGDTAQVGPQTAEKLEVPQITNAVKLESFNENEIVVSRCITNGIEVVKSPLPALVTVHCDAKQSRSRHAKLVIKNKKTAIPEWTADDLEPDFSRLGAKGSPTKVKNIENVVLTKKESRNIGNSEDDVNSLLNELISSHII
ncbi:MAG: electron transfer flavoprotein subunit beta/FixA family protein [Candidatus Limimorpha sp.]